MSSSYPWSCPKCDARPFQPCRTVTTGRVTDTHLIRINSRVVDPDPRRAVPLEQTNPETS